MMSSGMLISWQTLLLGVLANAVLPWALELRTGRSSYDEFRTQYGRGDLGDDYELRLGLFNQRLSTVRQINSQEGSWKAEINEFADYTPEEFQSLLGHRRLHRGSTNFLQLQSSVTQTSVGALGWPSFGDSLRRMAELLESSSGTLPPGLPESVDWRSQLNSSNFVKEQGTCGSCWALAAVGALEMHAEITSKRPPRELSVDQLLDCVANPQHCGGLGGCDGANSELAFEYVRQHGLYSSTSYDGTKKGDSCTGRASHPYVQLQGFVRLPTNNLNSVLQALASRGPLVVGVDASRWDVYGHGIFDGCDRDATINHAVVLVGYGRDILGKGYFLIRNSWGKAHPQGRPMKEFGVKAARPRCMVDFPRLIWLAVLHGNMSMRRSVSEPSLGRSGSAARLSIWAFFTECTKKTREYKQDPQNFTWGEKYKRLAGELRQVLADKAISVTDFKTPLLKKSQRIYDRYSEWERRLPKSTPSNASHKSSVPSRLGAFEVHLVQSTWDPERCCPATLGNHRHQGPAVNLPEGIFCTACAEVLRDERPMTYTKDSLKEQHMLLHSKLWTRRWPGLKPLLVRIGIATVPPPPLVPRPARLVEVDPPACQDVAPTPRSLTCERKTLKFPEDPADIIRKKMSALDCPAQKGWILDLSLGTEVLCKCGGGSHQLSVGAVIAEIQQKGFDGDTFRHFVEQKREQFQGEDVNAFLRSFLDTEGQEVMTRLVSERQQKVKDQRDLEESAFQRLLACKEDLMSQQRDICESYSTALREGQIQSERVFVKYCITCATSVPGAKVSIDPESTSVEDALEELDRAKQLNETLEKAWQDWEEAIECWLDVPEVFQQRPDLANANFDKDDADAKAAQLRKQADMIRRKMTKCLPDRSEYSDRLLRIQEEWAHRVEEYRDSGEGLPA
ncbi:CEP1 [Symbiodinium microadriaticum]|nr:CEP1 [Symbiodinium microadriaticum]